MKFKHPDDRGHQRQNEFGDVIYDEVIKKDVYGFRDFFRSPLAAETKSVVDIGANIGSFSLMAAVLFPSAKRIAIEPQLQNFELLQENMLALECKSVNLAIGDGQPMSLDADPRFSGSDSFREDKAGKTMTRSLSRILSQNNIPMEGLVIKCDCEGGEYYFVDDEDLVPYLRGCIWFACEFHEGHLGGKNTLARWDEWFDSHFGEGYELTKKQMGLDMGKMLWNYVAIKKE